MSDDLPAELRRIVATGDPLPAFRRDRVGRSVRLHLPLADVIALRQIATILATLAIELHRLSHARSANTAQILSLARDEMWKAAARLESVQNTHRKSGSNPVG